MLPPVLRLGLLHVAPQLGELEQNRELLFTATRLAAAAGADWIFSGELVQTGYRFASAIGTDWIRPAPDAWLTRYAALTASLSVAAFVHTPDLDAATGAIYSSLVAFDRAGQVAGRHRKICVIPQSEDWTTPGTHIGLVTIDGIRVALLVCADACLSEAGRHIRAADADIIVSSAAWHPGEHGPAGEWERCSAETGLPVVVCNRTGAEPGIDFRRAQSVVTHRGERRLTLTSPVSTLFLVELTRDDHELAFREVSRTEI
jgi:predicted amidohydrolase